MRKIVYLAFIFLSVISFLTSSCAPGLLEQHARIDDKFAELFKNLPPVEQYADFGIVYLLREKTVEAFEDGTSRETLHIIFRINNDRGKDWADISVGYNSLTDTISLLYAKTLTPEGKTIHLKPNATKVTTPFERFPSYNNYKQLVFSMPGVSVGSVIEYKVVRERSKPVIEGKFSNNFDFQMLNPALLCKYRVVIPKDVELRHLPLNFPKDVQLTPKISHGGSKKTYLWECQNMPGMIKEDSMPPWGEVGSRILVTTMDSWEEFSQWWRKQIQRKTEPNEAIRRKLKELTTNLSTTEEKVEAIFDYVKRQVRYVSIDFEKSGYEPQSASEVFENRYGDCKDKSTLLITMLKVAGIPAYYALIPTNDMASLIKGFPYPFQFNHCIVALEKEDGYQFIDTVGEDYRADYLPDYDQNRDVLIFKERETVFARTPSARPEENAFHNQYRIRIALNGSMECESRSSISGDIEASFRSFYISNNPTEVKEILEEKIDKDFKGARLIEYSHSDPLNFKQKSSLRMKFSAPDYCKKAGGMMICPLIPPRMSCSSTGKLERRYPLVIQTNSYAEEEIEFDIPENHEVYYFPEPVEIVNQYFTFRSQSQRKGKGIFHRREFIEKATSITPEEYPHYRKSCQEMEKSFKKDVLFKERKTILSDQ